MAVISMQAIAGFLFVLVAYALAVPVPPGERELEKRRESTPEIINLESQLKKAAGENKQYFTNENSRPMPQIDGLDTDQKTLAQMANSQYDEEDKEGIEDELTDTKEGDIISKEDMVKDDVGLKEEGKEAEDEKPVGHDESEEEDDEGEEEQQEDGGEEDEDEGEEEEDVRGDGEVEGNDKMDGEDQQLYSTMWKLFQEHPEYMEEIFQDYVGNNMPSEEQRGSPDNTWMYEDQAEMEDKRQGYPDYPYPAENELMNQGPVMPQKDIYAPDREAYMAYMASHPGTGYAAIQQPLDSIRQDFDDENPRGYGTDRGYDAEDEEELDSLLHQQKDINEGNISESEDGHEGEEVGEQPAIPANKGYKASWGDIGDVEVPPHVM